MLRFGKSQLKFPQSLDRLDNSIVPARKSPLGMNRMNEIVILA